MIHTFSVAVTSLVTVTVLVSPLDDVAVSDISTFSFEVCIVVDLVDGNVIFGGIGVDLIKIFGFVV